MKKYLSAIVLMAGCKMPAAEIIPPTIEYSYKEFLEPARRPGELTHVLFQRECEEFTQGVKKIYLCATNTTISTTADHDGDSIIDYEKIETHDDFNRVHVVWKEDSHYFAYTQDTYASFGRFTVDAYDSEFELLERKVFIDSNGDGNNNEIHYWTNCGNGLEHFLILDEDGDGKANFIEHTYQRPDNGILRVTRDTDLNGDSAIDEKLQEWVNDSQTQMSKLHRKYPRWTKKEMITIPQLNYIQTVSVPMQP